MTHSSTAPFAEATAPLPANTAILQVLPAMSNGGVERGTIEMARAIVQAGGRAIVASAGGPNVSRLQRVGAEHVVLPLASKNPLTILKNRRRLCKLIQAEGVALVHARSRAPAWSAGPAAKRAGVPFVTTYHGSYSERSWFKHQYNRIMVSGDRVIAISEFIATLIKRRYQTPDERLRIIHRGADLDQFNASAIGAGRLLELQRAWGIREETRVVLLPARMTRWKGQGVLIAALAALGQRQDFTNLAVVLAGDDEGRAGYMQELRQQCQRLGLSEGQVIFAGQCNDIPAATMLADVVVSASVEPEAFGRTMAEAAAMGKPIIASNIGAAPEIVLPGVTGWLVPPDDPDALADALQAALALTEGEREKLASAAVARAAALFSVESMCRKTLAVYRELLV